MHISQDRFDLTRQEQSGVAAFKKHIWRNSEVCSHCFSRVRAIGETVTVHMDKHRHEYHKFYERTEDASQEHTPFDECKRYGTCFCESCGADLRPDHHHLPWEKMKTFAVNLVEYVDGHTPLSLSKRRFARELARLRFDRRDTAGKESQVFAVAFARALETDVSTSGQPVAQSAG